MFWVALPPEPGDGTDDPNWPIRVFQALDLSDWFRCGHVTQDGQTRALSVIFA